MSAQDTRQAGKERAGGKVRDLPGCIKYILLVLVLLLLAGEVYSGEFRRFPDWSVFIWLVFLIKLLLIILLIWLIKVQRSLNCNITAPTGCTEEEADPVAGKLFVRVKGTASGTVFGHYTLEVRRGAITYPASIVSYPGGGASGTAPVINGELGQINTTGLLDATYEVILTVHPIGAGSPCVHTITFDLLKIVVYLSRIGKIPAIVPPDNANPFDPAAELRKDFAVAPPPPDFRLVSVGGVLSVEGSAYIYECAGRKIKNYEIRYASGELPQPATDTAIPASWPIANRIVFLEYPTPDHYQPWTRVGPAPRDLINSFTSFTVGGTTYFKLQASRWASGGVSGRLTLLLTAEDTTAGPHRYHDIQKIWLDNKPILALISGIENVNPCAELSLSQFAGAGMTVRGIAWDPLIDDALPPTVPNNNFDNYALTLFKQGGGHHAIGNFTSRVPARLTGAPPVVAPLAAVTEDGPLANFDIVTVLDAGNVASDSNVNIPRNTGCAYYLRLDVSDKTRINDDTDTHSNFDIWPFCIVNDIKG